MAYAALVSLSQTLDLVIDGDQNQIKSLLERLSFLQSFLEDYAHNSGENVDPFEGQIREAAYRAEYVVEFNILNQVRARRLVPKNGRMPDNERRRHEDSQKRYHKKLQRIIEQFDSIVGEAKKRKRSRRTEALTPNNSLGDVSSRQAVGYVNTVTGLDNDLIELKARVCGETDQLRTISIVGMAGIGKTTLARSIFEDSLVTEHFHIRAWLTVSQEYFWRGILLGLLSSLNAMNTDLTEKKDEILAEHVYKSLKGRRYIIIMDDIWSTKAWDDMRRILPDDNNGSRIILTSRLSEVAIYADSSSPLHQLQLLNEDKSWGLLQQKVFAQESCPLEFENVGKMIAGKCRGLPLAIVLVAGLLSKIVRSVNHWEKFAINVSSTLATKDEHMFNILSMSYNNLHHSLRACFLYMGGFPEDYEIPISKLTKLWTAEGFLKPALSKSLEEVAEEYVGDLVKRNLVSITKTSSTGRFRFCRIHDLLRDFCIRKAHDENFLHVTRRVSTSQQDVESKRRICCFMKHSIPSNQIGSLVRSLLFFNQKHFECLSISFSLLRVFIGTNARVDLWHPAFTELFHLRFLAFSTIYGYLTIPASISKLGNLQTLIIEPQDVYFRPLTEGLRMKIWLPSEIWKMPKLRHLILHNYLFLPVHSDRGISGNTSVLMNLQTLSRVLNFNFTKEFMEMIPNLKKLGVVYHDKGLIDQTDYSLDNLRYLNQLESLNLCWVMSSIPERSPYSHLVQNFALPQSLKKLTLTGCRLSWQKLRIVGRLPYLEVLKLRQKSVAGREWKSVEGEFLRLKFLLIERLNVRRWQAEYTHFPTLEHLIIRECPKLEEIPSEIGDIPSLRSIEVAGSECARESAIRIQEEQHSLGNDSLRVSST